MSRLPLLSHAMKSGVAWRALRRGLCQALGSSLLAVLLLGACTSGGARVPETDPSRVSAPVWEEHEIGPKESHSYPVDLAAGDVVRAVVDQGNADVAVELRGPDGTPVQTVDSLERAVWDEEVAAVADRSGRYQVVVRWGEERTGRYRLWIAEPRPATEADRVRVEALRLGYEAVGEASTGQRTEESLRRQLELRERALSLWQRLRDRPREAEALYQMGLLHRLLERLPEASVHMHEALSGLTDATQRAQVLDQAGMVNWELERLTAARKDFEEALHLVGQSEDWFLQFSVLNNLGRLLNNEFAEPRHAADSYFQEALRVARQAGSSAFEATALVNLGSAYANLSDYHAAWKHYQQALDIVRGPTGSPRRAAAALNNLGDTYLSLGEFPRAIQAFQQALELRTGSEPEREAKTLQNLGVAQEKMEQAEEALRSYGQALALARTLEDGDLQASILTNRAYLYLGQDRNEEARDDCLLARHLAASRETRARNLHMLGAAYRKLGDLSAAREALTQALELGQDNLALRADINLVLAKVADDAGDLGTAKELAAKAIGDIELLRERVVRQDLRESFLASKQSLYEFYIDLLMELEHKHPGRGYAAQALEQSERARARGLLDLLTEVGADLSRDADADLLAKEQRLRAEIGALYQHRLKLAQDGGAGEREVQARRRLEEAIERLHQVNAELRRSSPRYLALTRPEPLSLEGIRKKVLDPDSLLLEYALGEERSWLWVVTPDSIESFALPPRSEVEELAVLFYQQVSEQPDQNPARAARAESERLQTGRKLARILLAGAEPRLRGRRLLVVSDGALSYIPFRALPLPSSPAGRPVLLVEHNEVVDLPSASTLAVLRDEEAQHRSPGKILAAIGDPVFEERDARLRPPGNRRPRTGRDESAQRSAASGAFDPSRLPRLPYSGYEVDLIVKMVDPDQSLKAIGLEASRSLVTSGQLVDYRIVHFATHGWIDPDHPELSALAFSRFNQRGEPEPQEGLLRLADVYRLRLNADLVTLSACKTALGKEMRGEGLIGLTRGFMYAGSSRVLASLWSIEDRSTARLMLDFYSLRLKEGRTVPAALREAQLKALADPRRRHPYYWAGFSLQGEPR